MSFGQTEIIAFIHAAFVCVWGVVAQAIVCFRKAKVAGSIPAAGSSLYCFRSKGLGTASPQRTPKRTPIFLLRKNST